jgi:proline iminopeptidase
MKKDKTSTTTAPLATGHLPLDDIHSMYYEVWGNPEAPTPIVFLHGGPGGGYNPKHRNGFDFNKQRVIFLDQRGCGQSTPFGETKDNTTELLASDVIKLLDHLQETECMITGGSWGSFLALFIAIAHPKRVTKMLLNGIFLGTDAEMDYIYVDIAKTHFPEGRARFLASLHLPGTSTSAEIIKTYSAAMNSSDEALRSLAAYEWSAYENSISKLDYAPAEPYDPTVPVDEKSLAITILELHYFINHCFVADNFIMDNLDSIKHIPLQIVHGRYDMVCSPHNAVALKAAYGESAHLHTLLSNHASDTVMREVMMAYRRTFLV